MKIWVIECGSYPSDRDQEPALSTKDVSLEHCEIKNKRIKDDGRFEVFESIDEYLEATK